MSSAASNLNQLLAHPLIWRLGDKPAPAASGIATGCTELDSALPDSGWPAAGLTELLCDSIGIGEVSLLLPAMATCAPLTVRSSSITSRHGSSTPHASPLTPHGLIWIAPPHLPYAPALASAGVDLKKLLIVRPNTAADAWWAAEQAMRSGAAAMVVLWSASAANDYTMLRRLQLACGSAPCAGFVYRASHAARQASPAQVRAILHATSSGIELRIIKRRGMQAAPPLQVKMLWRAAFDVAQRNGSDESHIPRVTQRVVSRVVYASRDLRG